MNLAQLYSLTSGKQINKMYVYPRYYPLPIDNYIVIQPWSKASKNYSMWEEVMDLIYPHLKQLGISIIQVGAKDERPIKYAINTSGTTSWGQLSYIISKAKLVLTTDSISSHLAGHFNIPLVVLISNNFSSAVSPFFGDKSKQTILEPDRTNQNPLFTLEEHYPKQIDSICPFKVAESVLKLLDIDTNFNFKSLYMGQFFMNKALENCMDSVVDVKKLNAPNIICRMDINFNLAVLKNQLNLCPCQIITDEPIPASILQSFKPNILGVVYKITHKHNPLFIKDLIKYKIGYQLMSELPINELNTYKLDYMDLGIIHQLNFVIPSELKETNLSNIYFKTGKVLFSKNKFYNSFYSYINDQNFDPMKNEPHKIIDKNIELLLKEKDFCLFIEKKLD